MVEITDKNINVGDVTIEYRNDVKLLKSLLNLEKGKIVPDKESKKKDLIGEFLSDFIYLPDAFLHHDRLVLPRTKEFYAETIGEEMLDSDVIKRLEKNNILYFPSEEAYDLEEVKRWHGKLTNLINNDHRVYLLALLAAPSSERANKWLKEHDFIAKNVSFKQYWAGGADAIVEWINSVNINRLYAAIPDNIADDPTLSKGEVESSPGYCVFLTSDMSVIEAGYYSQDFRFFDDILREKYRQERDLIAKELQRRLDKSTEIALQIVLEKLSETKESREKKLIEKGRITDRQTYKIPFSFELLINELNRKSDPIDLIGVAIKKRKERGNKAFRTWLREYDNEMRKSWPDTDKIAKMDDELDQVADDLKKDSSCKISNEKTVHSLSNLGANIYKVLAGNIFSVKDVLNNFFELYSNRNFPHRGYMQKLGRVDHTVLDNLELDRIFGEQGKEFASILRYYSVVGKKADEILKMKRKT